MRLVDVGHTCTKTCKNEFDKWVCGKPAIYQEGKEYYCRHHSRMGRYVIRDGDTGPILARFDTEQQLREAIVNHPGMRMQKLSKSSRRDII